MPSRPIVEWLLLLLEQVVLATASIIFLAPLVMHVELATATILILVILVRPVVLATATVSAVSHTRSSRG